MRTNERLLEEYLRLNKSKIDSDLYYMVISTIDYCREIDSKVDDLQEELDKIYHRGFIYDCD